MAMDLIVLYTEKRSLKQPQIIKHTCQCSEEKLDETCNFHPHFLRRKSGRFLVTQFQIKFIDVENAKMTKSARALSKF